MTLERAALDHLCNVARRQAQEEFKDLTPLFVVHKGALKEKAVSRETSALLSYPDGEEILRAFKKAAKTGESGFLGLFDGFRKGKLPFLKTPHLYALFFIDAEDYEALEDARAHIYHLLWHALDLREAYASGETGSFEAREQFIIPKADETKAAEKNLVADVFSALALEMQDQGAGHIKKIAAWRAMKTLQAFSGYEAERFPYPVAMETTQLVYEDLKDSLDPKLRLYGRAAQLAKEVAMTHDAQSIRQWESFSFPAQEMAWAGREPEQILNAAVYASEDAYVKATAYLVSEAIDLKPQSLANADIYNPFAEPETNERYHRKACEAIFQTALAQALPTHDPAPFIQEAKRQSEMLARGELLGWCARALLAAAQIFEDKRQDDPAIPATLAFWEAYNRAPWKSLQALGADIMKLKRADVQVGRLDILAALEKYPDLASLKESALEIETAPLQRFARERKPENAAAREDHSATKDDFDFFTGIRKV